MSPPITEEPNEPQAAESSMTDGLPPAAGLSRRGVMVDLISGAIGFALTIPLVGYLFEPLSRLKGAGRWIKLGPASQFQGEKRTEVDFAYTRQDGWLPSTTKRRVIVAPEASGESRFTVFSSTCTHLGCGVRWEEEGKRFLCPCHGGVFDSEGNPVSGPVFKPLDRMEARVGRDGQLEVLEG